MSRTSIEEITAEQRAEVEALLRRRDLSARQRERVEMVKAWALGQDLAAIARWSAYLAQTRGVRIAPGWLRVLLAQQDFACGRPKHTLGHLQDPAEVAACQAALAAAEKKGGGGARALRDALPGRDTRRDQPVPL